MNLTAILAISKYRAPPRPARIALSRSYGHTYDLAKASPMRLLLLLLLLLPPLLIFVLVLVLVLVLVFVVVLILVLSEAALASPYTSANHRYLRLWLVYWY